MNPARFDLTTLALFVAVARHGSISAGARQSHLAVGAASKRISDLEAALGTPLLFRNASGVALTDAGQACLAHAQRVLQDLEQMAGALSDFAQGVRGQVRIAANTSSITQFLPEDLAGFMAAHPAVRIDLEEQNSADIVAALLENRADVGIIADRTPAQGLQTLAYRTDELVLVTPAGHALGGRRRVAFADTLDYDYVGLPPATSLATRLAEASARLAQPMRLRIQVRSFDAICRMVAATRAIGVLPRVAAEPHARSMGLRLIPLADDWARRGLLLAVRDLDVLTAAARLLVSHLRQQAGVEEAGLSPDAKPLLPD
ncbi:LysR substrate-binding domain-containing protein [Bordetella sp. 2513F-2]